MPIRKQQNNSRKQNKPWLTAGLKNSSAKKNDLFAKAKFSNAPEDYQNYKTFLNLFTKLKKKAQNDNYRDQAVLYGHDKAKTWQLINEISKRKTKKHNSIRYLNDKNGRKIGKYGRNQKTNKNG